LGIRKAKDIQVKYVNENSIPYHQTRGTKDLSEIKDIFDDEHHNWVSNTPCDSLYENGKRTYDLFKRDINPNTEVKKDKKYEKDERKKKNVKFSNSNAKTDMSVYNKNDTRD